jgi:secreted protein with Ig-like and vWFA domain
LNIVSAEWSIGNNAYWEVKRGSNTVLLLTDGQHVFDMSDSRLIDNGEAEATSNVVITKVGSGPGTLILKLHKTTSITGGSIY